MNPFEIIEKYYNPESALYNILIIHSSNVANKAIHIATHHPELNADKLFLWEASMLHDIGIFQTDAPKIECRGSEPYLSHGYLGHDLLIKHNLPQHALVCERHTGTGLSKEDIIKKKLKIPHRDMRPQSIEEQIICFADCFFSKTDLDKEKSIEKIQNGLSRFGETYIEQFNLWCKKFL